jgi:hypothetical protein
MFGAQGVLAQVVLAQGVLAQSVLAQRSKQSQFLNRLWSV